MVIPRVLRFGTAALLLAAAACSDGPADPEPTELGALADPEVPTFDIGPAGTTRGGPCVYSEADGRFTCPEMNRNGIVITRTFTLYDADGNVQAQFDRLTTASMRTETTAKGTATGRDGGTITVDRSGVMLVSGMAGEETERTLNGVENGTITRSFTDRAGVAVQVSDVVTDSTLALVVPVPRDRANHWPLSGARVHAVTTTHVVGGGEPRTFWRIVRETFDGSGVVQVEITTERGTMTCTRDLANRTSTCGRHP
ncbi:MAG: hypothetical protein HY337_05010 [Gemmatimonadetes bacterium]|nr:hypothetical protein [Gemmatimonadota bacterium]